jgi:tetratricopeptide (TPR) repeat protein
LTHYRCCVTAFSGWDISFVNSPKPFKTQDDMHDNDVKEKAEFLSKSRAYLDQSLYKEALDIAELWLKQHPMDADANIVCCHAFMRMGKIERVEEVLGNVEDTILQLSRIYSFMGDICLESGLTQEAMRFYRKFNAINPESIHAKKISDKLRSLTSTTDKPSNGMAEELYDHIGDVAPDFYTVTLAELYIRQGYIQMAADVLNEILKMDSENHRAAERLNDVKAMLKSMRHKEGVVQELTRWLQNMDRMRCYVS